MSISSRRVVFVAWSVSNADAVSVSVPPDGVRSLVMGVLSSGGGGWCRRVLLALVLESVGYVRDAAACACVDWPAARRMAEAERVFLGRATRRVSAGAG